MYHSGAHTIGSKDETNVLISFASFENDGSAKKFASMPRNDGSVPSIVLPSDRQQHRQYEKSDTKVHFHSLKDFDTCENVQEFLEKVRQNIATTTTTSQAKGGTNLFLQDFPSKGNLISNTF